MSKFNENDWTVKNVGTFACFEEFGFTADLFYKDEKVAVIKDLGTGASAFLTWNNKEMETFSKEVAASQPQIDASPRTPGKYMVDWSFVIMAHKLVNIEIFGTNP